MITLYRTHPSPLADDIQAVLQDLVLAHTVVPSTIPKLGCAPTSMR